MRRVVSVLAVMAVVAAMVAAMAMPAFAVKGGNPQDDKNNPTFPGTGAGNRTDYDQYENPVLQPPTLNTIEVCAKNLQAAQCR